MELLVANRLAHLSDLHQLLPGNHFGGLKRKNIVHALLVLQEIIYQAWRDKKILSLVTFDVQSAFSGVAPKVLAERLRQRQVPKTLVKLIEDFT